MQAMQVAQCYFDAWNRRDAEAIVATFGKGGTYSDPSAGEGLVGEAIAAYAKNMWSAFPDLVFDIRSIGHTEEGIVAAQWLMRGTNTGSFRGLPPTGRAVVLTGADFIHVEGDRIHSVQGYFDTRVVPEQLGLQVLIQPHALVRLRLVQALRWRRARKANQARLVLRFCKPVQTKKYRRSKISVGRLRPKCWRCPVS